jgi:hypothetical protein
MAAACDLTPKTGARQSGGSPVIRGWPAPADDLRLAARAMLLLGFAGVGFMSYRRRS